MTNIHSIEHKARELYRKLSPGVRHVLKDCELNVSGYITVATLKASIERYEATKAGERKT